MTESQYSTAPKPFIFVLMPFDPAFHDIYTFGIKGAANDVGAYAERVDEQKFDEGILQRIFNQISKADVIVADMSGRNPNVFYEVGYAHALGKIVILLTKSVDDIPFDLKHRQHIVYDGVIDKLRAELTGRLTWALAQAKSLRETNVNTAVQMEDVLFEVSGTQIRIAPMGISGPTVRVHPRLQNDLGFLLHCAIRNTSIMPAPPIESAQLFLKSKSPLKPANPAHLQTLLKSNHVDLNMEDPPSDRLGNFYELDWQIPSLPRAGVHSVRLGFKVAVHMPYEGDIQLRLRLNISSNAVDYPFILHCVLESNYFEIG